MSSRDTADLKRASVRLAIQFAVLIIVLFAALGGIVFAIVSASQEEATQRSLVDYSRIDSPRDAPPGVFVIIVEGGLTQTSPDTPPGLFDPATLQAVAQSGQAIEETRTLSGRTYLVRVSGDHGRVTQIAIDRHESQEELQRLGWALIASGAIAAVAAGLIAAWMARRAMRPLGEALALQRRFVTDASHELRTPLTLLSTRAQLLRRQLRNVRHDPVPAVSDGLEEIVQDARVLTEILEDLLIAADPRETAETSRLDLAALADEAVTTLRPEFDARGIAIERIGSVEPVLAAASRVSIQRLFTALMTNALDHARFVVRVEVTRQGKDAVVRVIDDGPGFPQGMGERVFDRFASSRAANADGERPRHYGLGLALVAEVAARHQGAVSIEARQPGQGAVVVVRLPTDA